MTPICNNASADIFVFSMFSIMFLRKYLGREEDFWEILNGLQTDELLEKKRKENITMEKDEFTAGLWIYKLFL